MEGSTHWGNVNVLRHFNTELAKAVRPGVTLFDLDYLSSLFGKWRWYDQRLWFHSKHAFSLDAIGPAAFHAARLISGIKGRAKKAIVLDLDNTLWGGVIGDDGLEGIRLGYGADGEAFVTFQEYLLSLKNRGVLLTVCSKNEEEIAKEPFRSHPDMKLTLDDITVFRANWHNKADNVREIASIVNLGLDAFVFVDDNPVEREFVRRSLPMVSVPELPEDPCEYINCLDRGCFFETISFSTEDKIRSVLYKENVARREFQFQFSDLSSYLQSLEMEATVGLCNSFHLKRMAQLINKSNQFHLTGTRYSEAELEEMSGRPDRTVLYFGLKDRFGDNGLISVVIVRFEGRASIVDTWVMSCRVLSRGMEEFVYRELLRMARDRNCDRILGSYVPSKKNKLVEDLYRRLNFSSIGAEAGTTHWELALDDDTPIYEVYIRRAGND